MRAACTPRPTPTGTCPNGACALGIAPGRIGNKPRALLDAHATWRISDDYSITAAVTNLTDKRYWANLDYANYGEPRRYSLSFKARF